MSDEKDPGVDPRFDPAFQRGFDPSVPIEEYVPAQQARKSATAEQSVAAPARVTPPAAPKPAPASAPEQELVIVAGAEDLDESATGEHTDADADANPARNPFLLFLGIVAVGLVAAGIWLFVRSGEAFNSAEVRSQGDYMSLDATIHTAPFIALLGGATAIGILFMFASKYRRKP